MLAFFLCIVMMLKVNKRIEKVSRSFEAPLSIVAFLHVLTIITWLTYMNMFRPIFKPKGWCCCCCCCILYLYCLNSVIFDDLK